ncbi:MAG: T9SS type A sorting domain-containing protein [Saprospiraceae bacterium]|nr:T9SS type A sorting domain-containing protein [Saprospiraceae bacterium]
MTANFKKIVISNIGEDLADDTFTAYPNPTNGRVVVDLNTSKSLKIKSLSIKNVLGVEIMRAATLSASQFQFDLTHQADGLYFIQFNIEGGMLTKKIFLKK